MRGEFYLVLTTLLAALGWGASKMVVTAMPGDIFIGTRFLLAGMLLLPGCYKQLRNLTRKQLVPLIGVGLILSVSLQVWVYAVSITDSLSEGAFIMSLAMIIAPFTAWVMFRSRPNQAYWLALPIATLGMMLLTLNNGWALEESQLGFLTASILLSVHFVLNKRLTSSISPLVAICAQLLVVGSSGILFAQVNSHPPYELNGHIWLWFVISAVVATAIRYCVQTLGQSSVKMETASLIMILEPLWTLLISLTLLNEGLELQRLIGGAVIMASLFIYRRQESYSVRVARKLKA